MRNMCGGVSTIKQSVSAFKILTAFTHRNKKNATVCRGAYFTGGVLKDTPRVMKYKVM